MLPEPCFSTPPPLREVLPGFARNWCRAAAASTVRAAPAIFDACNSGRKQTSLSEDWQPTYLPYLISAVSGKQWCQARSAATAAEWTDVDKCRLCEAHKGSLMHRHFCPKTCPPEGWTAPPPDVARHLAFRGQNCTELWQTRGIGGTRVFVQPRQTEETVRWIIPIPDSANYQELTWYVDASQIDTEGEAAAARYGVGAVAVSPRGELVAAAYAVPPVYIDTIPAAEAWALWLVLSCTLTRKQVITDAWPISIPSELGKLLRPALRTGWPGCGAGSSLRWTMTCAASPTDG